MNANRITKKVWRTAVLLLLAIPAVACTDGNRSRVAGTKLQYVPGPTVTVTAAPATPVVVTKPTAETTQIQQPGERRATQPARRVTRRTAQYTISVDCSYFVRRQNGSVVLGDGFGEPLALRAGLTKTYEFSYERGDSDDPIVEQTDSCTTATQRTRVGVEPRLRVLLGCEGEATYTSNPRPTSTDAGSWRPSELLSGHTHVMTAPKSPEHISEHVRCTVSVIAR